MYQRRWGTQRSLIGVVMLALATATLVAVPAGPAHAAVIDFARVPLDRWDVDGAVYAVEIVGDTVYIGGEFDNVRSADGSTLIPRQNLAAIDLESGTVLPFRADTNDRVSAIESSDTRLYVGGRFTTVGSMERRHLAALNRTSGAVVEAFDPSPDDVVLDIELVGSSLYVAGQFNSIAGYDLGRHLIALDPVSGALLDGFDPDPDRPVYSLVSSPSGDRLYVGGAFHRIGDVDRRWLRAVDPATGVAVGPFFESVGAVVVALDISADGGTVYGGVGGSRNAAIAWDADTGALLWSHIVSGDVQAVELVEGNLFFGFHEHTTDDPTVRLLAADAATGVLEDSFRPPVDSGYGVLALGSYSGGLVAGGTFANVSGVPTRGLAVFPRLDGTGGGGGGGGGGSADTDPPTTPTGLTASPLSMSEVELEWNASTDAGTGVAYYQVTRDGDPVASVAAPSMVDTGLSATLTYTYRVKAVDVAGNISASSAPLSVTMPTRFLDVLGSNIFAADIEWLASTGITRGCNPPANDRFCPDDPVTRGQMAAFLVRAMGYSDVGSVDFVDDGGSVFEPDIERLAEAGVTRGCNPPSNDRFCPDDSVTRGQMAAFLVRAMGYSDVGSVDFVDDGGSVFESDIERLAEAGVTRGCNPPANDRFCPDELVTRGQMAAFLHRALPD